LADVPGVVWRKDARRRGTALEWIDPLDGLAPADREPLNAARNHDTPGTAGFANMATVQGKRGCPPLCIYCSTTTMILHASRSTAAGFRITFLALGIVFLATVPLVFLVPTGKQVRARPRNPCQRPPPCSPIPAQGPQQKPPRRGM
jgi:hypothetical protein